MHHRRYSCRRRLFLASALATTPYLAHAQIWISPTDASWSDAARWSALPVPGASTALIFSPTGTQTYVATDDFGAPFTVGTLSFAGTSSGSITLGAGPTAGMRFGVGSSAITNSSLSQVTINGRDDIRANGLTFNL